MRKPLAEFIGTFILVFAGTGAIVIDDVSGGKIGHPGIALVFGLVVMVLIYALGDISGAHFNPAVTLGFWVARRFPSRWVAPYIASQVAGALFASLLLRILFANASGLGATNPSGPAWQSAILEVVMMAFLMLVILNVSEGSKEKGIMAGVAVGGAIAVDALFGGPISGASMNPARSLAPALVAGSMKHVWIYLVAPLAGSLLAVVTARLLKEPRPPDNGAESS